MSVIYAVKVEVAPEVEAGWDSWNTEHHIPHVLREQGFVRATKYKVETPTGEWPQYIVHYEVSSREALELYLTGGAAQRLRGEHIALYGKTTRLSRMILSEVARFGEPGGGESLF